MKFPLTIQRSTNDCGPTCLKMLADFYGRDFGLRYLKGKFRMRKAGVSMLDIHKAAELIGFESTGVRINMEQLKEIVQDIPVIFHCNENHFVVIYKVPKPQKKGIFYIADPSKGIVTCREAEFIKYWMGNNSGKKVNPDFPDKAIGYCLLLEPTQEFYGRSMKRYK